MKHKSLTVSPKSAKGSEAKANRTVKQHHHLSMHTDDVTSPSGETKNRTSFLYLSFPLLVRQQCTSIFREGTAANIGLPGGEVDRWWKDLNPDLHIRTPRPYALGHPRPRSVVLKSYSNLPHANCHKLSLVRLSAYPAHNKNNRYDHVDCKRTRTLVIRCNHTVQQLSTISSFHKNSYP